MTISAQNQLSHMEILAKKFGADTEFTSKLEAFLKAGETVKMGPLNLMLALDADMLSELPVPGSKTGNNPDVIETTVPDEKNGGTKTVKTSAYNVLADKHPLGAKINATLADLKKRKDNNELGEVTYARDNKKWSARKLALRGVFRNMGALYHQFTALQACKLVIAEPAMIERNVNGEVVKEVDQSSTPIRLQSEADRNNLRMMTVQAFLRIDVAEAIENSGGADKVTLEALLKTMKRSAGGPKAAKLTIETVEGVLSGTFHFLDDADTLAKFTKVINTRSADGDRMLLAADALYTKLDGILSPLNRVIATLHDRQNAEENKDAA
jgi:hypothetical protein